MGYRSVLGLDLHWVRIPSFLKLSLYSGRKFCPASPGPQVQEYGGFSKINDTIGILLEFKDTVGSVSFYRNGVRLTEYVTLFSNL